MSKTREHYEREAREAAKADPTAKHVPLVRSNGPMAATVDRMTYRTMQPLNATQFWCESEHLDAALRRAAIAAAQEWWDISDDFGRTVTPMCDMIERHVRRELGL